MHAVLPGKMLSSQFAQNTTQTTHGASIGPVDRISMLDDLIHETFHKKQSLNDVNTELLDSYMTSFAVKVSQAKKLRKTQKSLIE